MYSTGFNDFGPVIELQCAGNANIFIMMGSRGVGGGGACRGCLDRHTLHTGTTARPSGLCHSIKTQEDFFLVAKI